MEISKKCIPIREGGLIYLKEEDLQKYQAVFIKVCDCIATSIFLNNGDEIHYHHHRENSLQDLFCKLKEICDKKALEIEKIKLVGGGLVNLAYPRTGDKVNKIFYKLDDNNLVEDRMEEITWGKDFRNIRKQIYSAFEEKNHNVFEVKGKYDIAKAMNSGLFQASLFEKSDIAEDKIKKLIELINILYETKIIQDGEDIVKYSFVPKRVEDFIGYRSKDKIKLVLKSLFGDEIEKKIEDWYSKGGINIYNGYDKNFCISNDRFEKNKFDIGKSYHGTVNHKKDEMDSSIYNEDEEFGRHEVVDVTNFFKSILESKPPKIDIIEQKPIKFDEDLFKEDKISEPYEERQRKSSNLTNLDIIVELEQEGVPKKYQDIIKSKDKSQSFLDI